MAEPRIEIPVALEPPVDPPVDRRKAPTIEQVPTDDQLTPEMVARLGELPPLRIQRPLALVPECFEGWQALLGGLYSGDLDPRLREIVICRVGAKAHCDYELDAHTAMKWLILMSRYACVVRVLNGLRVQLEATRELDGRSSPLG